MAASLKVVKQSRSWKLKDSNGSEDLENLFNSGNVSYTKPVTCNKYWSFYLCLFGVFALFLFGIVVGFYLRADPKVFKDCARSLPRKDGLDKEKLESVHNNIMYFMSGDRLDRYSRELAAQTKQDTLTHWETSRSTAKYVEREFRKFEFDKVEVEKHNVVITSPDPAKPNTLELLTLAGTYQRNRTSTNGGNQTLNKWNLSKDVHASGFVAFSPSRNVRGPVHFGHTGTYIDFLQVQKNNISLNGSVVLVELGGITVPEKVKNAEKFGAIGVLLFCNHDNYSFHGNCDPSSPFVSTSDFLAIKEDQYPRIPVQTVSQDVALSILKKIHGTSPDNVTLVDFKSVKTSRNESSRIIVKLNVSYVRRPRTVYNVIGTIYGSDEIDREVIVGAGNQIRNQSTTNGRQMNLAILLELANSLNFIKKTQGWRPRRTVKLAFFGGKDLSNVGLVKHLKNRRHILQDQGVGYIDLDLSTVGQKYMKVETSPSLVSMVTKAALMVPDPGNPDLSLADTWPILSHDWYVTNQYPVHNYRTASWYPLLKEIGMTSVFMKAVQYDKISSHLLPGEVTHHFKYHLAAARVTSNILLQFADNPKLPFDMEFGVQFVVKSVNRSLNRLKQFMEFPREVADALVAAVNKLNSLRQNITAKVTTKSCMSSLQLRSMNDLIMKWDSLFLDTLPIHRTKDYLLKTDRETGTLSILLDAVNSYLLTGNRDTVYRTLQVLTHSLDQVFIEMKAVLEES